MNHLARNEATAQLAANANARAYGEFLGRRYDCGTKLGYLEATVDYGLKHPEVGDDFRAFLQGVVPASRSQ